MRVAAALVDDGKTLIEHGIPDSAQPGSKGEFVLTGMFGRRMMRIVGVTAGWKIARVVVRDKDVTAVDTRP